MTEVETRDIPQLNWDVLVIPGIPIATSDLPPGMKQGMFQAIASTILFNNNKGCDFFDMHNREFMEKIVKLSFFSLNAISDKTLETKLMLFFIQDVSY